MPRPPRCRRICRAPQADTLYPQDCRDDEPILLTLDAAITAVTNKEAEVPMTTGTEHRRKIERLGLVV